MEFDEERILTVRGSDHLGRVYRIDRDDGRVILEFNLQPPKAIVGSHFRYFLWILLNHVMLSY
jgi:hypothetical protein